MKTIFLAAVVIVITAVVIGMIRNNKKKNVKGKGGTGYNNPEPKDNKPNDTLTDG
jgi:hypothetical protein